MTTKKTLPIPALGDAVPKPLPDADKTRELPHIQLDPTGAPRKVIDDDVTVPVHSSIESTLNFEMLRRQSTETEDVEKDEADEDGSHETLDASEE